MAKHENYSQNKANLKKKGKYNVITEKSGKIWKNLGKL